MDLGISNVYIKMPKGSWGSKLQASNPKKIEERHSQPSMDINILFFQQQPKKNRTTKYMDAVELSKQKQKLKRIEVQEIKKQKIVEQLRLFTQAKRDKKDWEEQFKEDKDRFESGFLGLP